MIASPPRMAARRASLLALIAFVLVLGSPALASITKAGSSKHQAVKTPLVGVNVSGGGSNPLVTADLEVARAHALHSTVLRTEVEWSTLEPNGPAAISQHELEYNDRLTRDAAALGIRVIMFVDSTPCWASSAPASLLASCQPGEPSAANDWPPKNPADYAAAVAFLARRYGAQLAAIEIWNEPDQVNELYFAGPEKVRRYADLLRAAYPAIKHADPGVHVIAGSLVGSSGVFLRALYAAGIKGYYDGLSVHYYDLTLAAVRAIREVQLANGDAKPLWLAEFGWSDCYPHQQIQEETPCVTEQAQATNLRTTIRELAHASYIAAIVVFKLQDSPGVNFGVLTTTGAHKRSFAALAQALATPFGAISRVTLSLHRHSGGVVASGSGPVGDYLELEVFKAGVVRYKALFVLDRFNRYSIVLPRALGRRGLQVRVYQYWLGPSKAAKRTI